MFRAVFIAEVSRNIVFRRLFLFDFGSLIGLRFFRSDQMGRCSVLLPVLTCEAFKLFWLVDVDWLFVKLFQLFELLNLKSLFLKVTVFERPVVLFT